jgi:hypothetical protein
VESAQICHIVTTQCCTQMLLLHTVCICSFLCTTIRVQKIIHVYILIWLQHSTKKDKTKNTQI